MAEQSQNRQVAYKVRIASLLDGKYVKEEGWKPNYVLTQDGKRVSRVNLMGTVVSTPTVEMNYRSMTLDDGSMQISVRSFDEPDMFHGISMGDIIFIIGRPRQYNNQIYIMPEIIKKVNNKLWIEVRKLEIEKQKGAEKNEGLQDPQTSERIPTVHEVVNEELVEEINAEEKKVEEPANEQKPNTESHSQKIYSLIKELDNGEGANFEEILEKSGVSEAEKIISQLLKEGEIFELAKGKLKVLE